MIQSLKGYRKVLKINKNNNQFQLDKINMYNNGFEIKIKFALLFF